MALVLIAEKEEQLSGNNYPKIALRIEWYRDNAGSGVDAAANDEDITAKAFLIKRGENANGSTSHNLNGPGSVVVLANIDTDEPLETVHASSGISYDFRSTSGRNIKGTTQLLWEGTVTVQHNADGTKTMAFSVAWTGDGNLGDRTISGAVTLPTITQVPNAPTDVVATRLSDSSTKVEWAQSHPSNGQPTTNTVQRRLNGGTPSTITTVSPTTSVTVSSAANQKLEYRTRAGNAAGNSAWSAWSAPVYTTPAAPTGLTATKNADGDIELAWVRNAAYSEHSQPIEHSEDDGPWVPLDTAGSNLDTYTHVDPDPAKTHRYRVKAESTTGALSSAWSTSESVQLLAPPNKPTLPDLPDFADRGSAFVLPWTHNPVDTTAQTAYESAYSTNGGDSWTSTGKTTSTGGSKSYAAGTWSADQSVLFRVRTWGQATSGGSDGTGASPWSDAQSVTFKSAPVVTITSPTDESTWEQAELVVNLGFSQAEGATFVQATVTLSDGDGDLETVVAGTLSGITFETPVADGGSYTISAVVLDSNGVLSAAAEAEFDVSYTLPVAADASVEYLRESGVAQITLAFPEPGDDEVAAAAVTITRTINGVTETVVAAHPVTEPTDTIIDTTPTIHGTNAYLIRTISEDGAYADVELTLTTSEDMWVFLSSGPGFADIVKLSRRVRFGSTPRREAALVAAAGRSKRIAQFGPLRTLDVHGTASVMEADIAALVGDTGSTVEEIEEFLLNATRVCYRDPTGRRIFGTASGQFGDRDGIEAAFSFTVAEAE